MTTNAQQWGAKHPEFPWLYPAKPSRIASFLEERKWLERGETVTEIERAGDGNMNLTLRVCTTKRMLLLKQARPWVEKFPSIPAPWDRAIMEQQFYARITAFPEIAKRMPKLIAADVESRTTLLEFLDGSSDFSVVYANQAIDDESLRSVALYAADLHARTENEFDARFRNSEMRRLNHEHIFVFPLKDEENARLPTSSAWSQSSGV